MTYGIKLEQEQLAWGESRSSVVRGRVGEWPETQEGGGSLLTFFQYVSY